MAEQDEYSKPHVDLPVGFEDEAAFITWVTKTYEEDLAADDDNRKAALEDSEFLAGEQWDERDEAYRKDNRLPVLTVNQLPAFVGTVIGNRRLNETTVAVSPDSGTSRGLANLREGIIRSVLKNSVAKRAFDKAFENQVTCGIGSFEVCLDYASNDVFDQNIIVKMIAHPLAVVYDRFSTDPTARDAKHAFQAEVVTEREYYSRWPNASGAEMGGEVDNWARQRGWLTGSDKHVLTVWRMNEKTKLLAMMTDGTIQDITGQDPDQIVAAANAQAEQIQLQLAAAQAQGQEIDPSQIQMPLSIVVNPKTQSLMVREAPVLFAQRWVVSSKEILEGPYELPIDRIPIFRCQGWEVNIGNRRVRWGVVRLAKDAQRLFNFWRSVVAEKLLYAPKATVMGPVSAFEGLTDDWRNMHLKREPLKYNDDAATKPEFLQPPQPDVALLQQASLAVQDMRDVLNLHEASLGMQSNEVSAKAIISRQRIGEMGTVIYGDNMNAAVEECGRVINQLIPVCYDTPRVVKVTGADDQEEMKAINSGQDNDVTLGNYVITLHTGPSYATKRAEAADAMMNFVNAAPQIAAVAPDLIVEAQDWPNAGAIAARFRKAVPANLLGPEELTPEQTQNAQQQALMQQAQFTLAMRKEAADADSKESAAVHSRAMANESIARAMQAKAQAAAALANADTQRIDVVGTLIDKEHDRLADLYKSEREASVQREQHIAARERSADRAAKE